jgi:DNA-binding SARP family transcriptional activator
MATLQVFLFGNVRIAHAGWASEVKITRAIQALLAYLMLHRHRVHPREVLVDLFWGHHPEEQARRSLSTALWRLRQALKPAGTGKDDYLRTTPTGELGFNCQSDYWLDVALFEDKAASIVKKTVQSMERNDAKELEDALKLYTGELLEGFYDDWALRERERLRSLYLKSLAHLMRYYGDHGLYENAVAWGQQIFDLDPLREEIHREVMRLYSESGNRAMAIRQYKTCSQILKTELGIPPMEETQRLFHQIRLQEDSDSLQTAPFAAQTAASFGETPSLEEACQKLRLAIQHFEKTGEQLQQALQLFEQIAKGR